MGDEIITATIRIAPAEPAGYAETKAALLAWRARHAGEIVRTWITMANESPAPPSWRRPRLLLTELRAAALADLPAGALATPIDPLAPAWCLVALAPARSRDGRGGWYAGTKHFAPGAEVFFHYIFSGDGYERAFATGRHRDTGYFVTLMQPTKRFAGWRAAMISDPIVLFELRQYGRGWGDGAPISAQEMAEEMLLREALARGSDPRES
ncbi:MAG TPA: hypothetical protein VGE07_27075 [Herpetosiphonaceae bacterium]